MDRMNEQITALYYDTKGAAAALGIRVDRLDYLIDLGLLKPVRLQGYKTKRFFVKTVVDALARQQAALLLASARANLEYRFATVEDVSQETDLSVLVFGNAARNPLTVAARRHFIEVNPFVTHHLYDNGLLVASLNFVPVTPDAIKEFKEGKRGWLFSDKQIEQFTNTHPLQCILIDFMTNPTVPTLQRRVYGMRLLSDFAGQMEQWGAQGIEISDVYSSGGSPEGRRLLQSSGFEFLSKQGERRHIYHLNIPSSPLHLLGGYRKAFAEYRAGQSNVEQ